MAYLLLGMKSLGLQADQILEEFDTDLLTA